jgi:drug/metabolite transporter (DMT)-like permease
LLTQTAKAYWALAGISFFWGTTWVISKMAMDYFDPLFMTAIRQTIAGLIMMSYFFFRKKYIPTAREIVLHFILGLLFFMGANGFTTWGIKFIPSGLGALLSCLFPLFLVLFNFILFKKRIHPKSLIGLLIGFGGVAFIFSGFLNDLIRSEFLGGILLVLCGVLSWTFGTIITSKYVQKKNGFGGLGWQMLFGGMQLAIFSVLKDENHNLDLPKEAWLLLAYLIIVGSILCFLCFMYALQNLPQEIAGIYAYIIPIVALICGAIILKEPISVRLIIGAVITVIGVYMVNYYSRTAKKK